VTGRHSFRRLGASRPARFAIVLLLASLLSSFFALGQGAQGAAGGPVAAAADPVYVAAGDIACSSTDGSDSNHCQDSATASLVRSMSPSGLFILGDAQYTGASVVTQGIGVSIDDYNSNYDSTWGSIPTAKQYPTPGHYDWGDQNESDSGPWQGDPDYFQYFRSSNLATSGLPSGVVTDCLSGSPPCNDWYSFNVTANSVNWHVIVLDSICGAVGGCGQGSPEETFLKHDLSTNTNACVLAVWADPRFSSGPGGDTGVGDDPAYDAFWKDLYAAHATIVLGGHDHLMEDFAPMNPSQAADPAEGLTELVSGAGGRGHSRIADPNEPNTIFRDNTHFGVLKLTLHAQSADYAFVGTGSAGTLDSGTVGCIVTPPAPTNVSATPFNSSAAVSWTNASPGGRQPDSWTITPVIGSTPQTGLAKTVGGATTNITITGLTNGTSYTFRVTGANSRGTGQPGTSNAATPVAVPGAPTGVSAIAGNASAVVRWTAPADVGGGPLTGYSIVPLVGSSPQPAQPAPASATSLQVTGLTNGTTYAFTVAASNDAGTGPPSSPSNRVVPLAPGQTPPPGSGSGGGYWAVASDGGIFNYGDATFHGSAGAIHLNQPIVGMAPTPDGGGYWLVASDGGIFNYGDAKFYGSAGGIHLNKPIVGMAATADGQGYWLVASDGGIFNYGDATFHGSAGGIHLNQPIVGMASTADGGGYWLVATDGGIFNYGDAGFHGSAGGIHLNKPIKGMAATPAGGGYWLVANDGGIFNYGDAAFFGSAGGIHLNQPIVGMADTPDGGGYWLVATDGGIFTYGDATFLGSAGGLRLSKPVVGLARTNG